MLSVQEIRALIPEPNRSNLSDVEIKKIRDAGYVFADAIFDQWLAERNKSKTDQTSNDVKVS